MNEYAAFFGSIQIFKYLYLNGVELTSSLWFYGIHGDNSELFQILEENKIIPKVKSNNIGLYSLEKCLKESIKCHHNGIANYILTNLLNSEQIEQLKKRIIMYGFHYYNFYYFPKKENYNLFFYFACKYDHYIIVDYLLKTKKICIKDNMIFNYHLIYIEFNYYYLEMKF